MTINPGWKFSKLQFKEEKIGVYSQYKLDDEKVAFSKSNLPIQIRDINFRVLIDRL